MLSAILHLLGAWIRWAFYLGKKSINDLYDDLFLNYIVSAFAIFFLVLLIILILKVMS